MFRYYADGYIDAPAIWRKRIVTFTTETRHPSIWILPRRTGIETDKRRAYSTP